MRNIIICIIQDLGNFVTCDNLPLYIIYTRLRLSNGWFTICKEKLVFFQICLSGDLAGASPVLLGCGNPSWRTFKLAKPWFSTNTAVAGGCTKIILTKKRFMGWCNSDSLSPNRKRWGIWLSDLLDLFFWLWKDLPGQETSQRSYTSLDL